MQTKAEHAGAAEAGAAGSPHASQLRVAAVQMRSSRDLDSNVAKIEDYLRRCATEGVKLIVFPECALTGYFDDAYMKSFNAEQLDSAERKLTKACREHRVYAIVGTPPSRRRSTL